MSSATIQAPSKISTWNIDPVHSNLEFAVKHMMVSTVRGRFREVAGAIHLSEADPASSWVEATIPTASVDTAAPRAMPTCARRTSSRQSASRR